MKIINVMASSLDGKIGLHGLEGDAERKDVGISSIEDEIFLRHQIEGSDAIIVGASSIRANGECLDHRGKNGSPPVWYIFAERPIEPSLKFWEQKHISRVVISKYPLPCPAGSEVCNLTYGSEDPCLFLNSILIEKKHEICLLFGGGIINRWFYQHNLVDELKLTLAPIFVGKSSSPQLIAPELSEIVKFNLLTSQVAESFVFLTYQVRR